ncbi:Pentatricopeptide repeat-containing protein, chloroplastic, partial [Mucuna pruriens]
IWYRPNSGVYIKLIVMLGKCKQPKKAHELFQAMVFAFDKVQSLLSDMANHGIKPNTVTYNTLIDAYGKARNAVMEYMQKYHYSWTIVTFNIVIDAFGKAGDLKQMEYLFRLMRSERIKPSCVTLCSLVRAYAHAGKPEKIGGVLRFVENSDVLLDTVFFNCLIDAYGRLGCLAEMKAVLEMMKQKSCKPDIITYRTMIKAYSFKGMDGHAKELRELLPTVNRPPLKRDKPDF